MNLNKAWVLQIDPDLKKDLKRFPKKDTKRVLSVIEDLVANPYIGDIQKMKGEKNVWRRRIGSYRLFYEIIPDQRIIHIYHAERRTSATY